MSEKKFDVLGIGNALVDVLAKVDEVFLAEHCLAHGVHKGTMALISEARAQGLYEKINECTETSGGCAGNTLAGLASFGGKGAFIGKVANDVLGDIFVRHLDESAITYQTPRLEDSIATGRCIILVTPDADRTMNTFLGASVEISSDDIDEDLIEQSKIVYLEGYLFDKNQAKAAFRKSAKVAHEKNVKVALTLSDPFCVERHRADFKTLIENHVDILFANEDEIKSLFETDDFDEALNQIEGQCEIIAITRGAQGAIILSNKARIMIKAEPVETVVDTTGAGDQFAAGFLYGLTSGADLSVCGRLGSLAAAEVISHMGPRPHVSLAKLAQDKQKVA